jgi:hypothetical protein
MTFTADDFILVQFNQTIALDVSGAFDTSYVEIGAYDAMCQVDICLNEWASCFKITSDSQDINNVDASDITYYVINNASAGGLKGTYLNKASLAGGSSLKDGNPATSTVSSTPVVGGATSNQLEYDFIRHISNQLFNTPNGVDLFNNETELRLSVEQSCNDGEGKLLYNINQILVSADASYSSGSTNKDNSYNLTYTLLNQLFQKQPSRFNQYVISDTVPTILPWANGDKIWYILTVNAAPNQHLLVGKNTAVTSRKYLIKMRLVS